MSDEISTMEENEKNSRIKEIELPEKICQKSCRICSSDYLKEIHSLRNDGAEFQKIAGILFEKYKFKISQSSLSNHFFNYREIKKTLSAQLIRGDLLCEATELARHTKVVVSLLDKYLVDLEAKVSNNHYKPNIADLEKLFNIRHKILAGDVNSEKDLMAIFVRAQMEFGIDINRGVELPLKYVEQAGCPTSH